MEKRELLATIVIDRVSPTHIHVRVQKADGKWHEVQLERVFDPGWSELRQIAMNVWNDLKGDPMLPW